MPFGREDRRQCDRHRSGLIWGENHWNEGEILDAVQCESDMHDAREGVSGREMRNVIRTKVRDGQ